ncbi:hypothetical protein GQ43DRAFT_475313 [Delitschia confertaspora ATCC 74209]|uniref:T6SS Phospholipase effector Tle1-like catalytic domain-containing protein n=1 Tax=Delitschia confertaspora ATCC 74209 TaxID=1513339 RepID=A0A9P4JDR7_9PLEO|nr:hypothetical protein GQ43DRAFT_475313 [Delitschia confertaspora ATCC 74209]
MSADCLRVTKKLIACCDGTWMNSDKGYVKGGLFSGPGHLQTPSNVTRISRAILNEDKEYHAQIVYYQSGVGGGNTTLERLIGGGTGEGIGEHMREAYSFLANNYDQGDSIFLLGFSRGAFTARSIAGLIGGMGLLEKAGLPWFYLIFRDWEHAGVEGYKPMLPNAIPGFEISAPPTDIENYLTSYRNELKKRGLTREVEIQAIGVWDTVGALGIPTPKFIQQLGLPDFLNDYKFFDTSLDNHIKYAFHALALDEQRSPYGPAVWERKPGCHTVLKQTWFPGVHSNVGGSYDDTGLADITLAWMMSNLSPWIDFNPDYIREQALLDQKRNHEIGLHRGWSLGKIVNSVTFPVSILGREARTPSMYNRLDPKSGRETNQPLMETNETVHPSVRARIQLGGKGYEDQGRYSSHALADWKTETVQIRSDDAVNGTGVKKQIKWVYKGSQPRGQGREMLEEPLGQFELELLKMDPVTTELLLWE